MNKRLIHDIHIGKDLTKNLKKYQQLAIPLYEDYGALELTFSAYLFLEETTECEEGYEPLEVEAASAIWEALARLDQDTPDTKGLATDMISMRENITKRMDLLTAYTDRLIVYQYVLNRLEYRYVPEKKCKEILARFPEDTYMAHINHYLFSNKDKNAVVERAGEVMSEVPIRMTKTKLADRIMETSTLYKGQDVSSFESWIYRLRTASMVYEPDAYVGEYQLIEDALDILGKADYDDLSKEEYDKLADTLEDAAREIHKLTDFYYSLQKMVNRIYAMCLVYPYIEEPSDLLTSCATVWDSLLEGRYTEEMLMPLEGKIEHLVEDTSYLESVFFEIKSSYKKEVEEAGLTSFFHDFADVVQLLSDSLFIDLESTDADTMAGDSYIQRLTADVAEEIQDRIAHETKPVRRGIMAQVIKNLPMAFESPKELQEYIRTNLFECSDQSEKIASLMLIWSMIQDEMEWSRDA